MEWTARQLRSGVFLVLLRPFKVGDFISAGGVTGTVTRSDYS
jgi:small conductance mechanosensitive channel